MNKIFSLSLPQQCIKMNLNIGSLINYQITIDIIGREHFDFVKNPSPRICTYTPNPDFLQWLKDENIKYELEDNIIWVDSVEEIASIKLRWF